MRRAVAWASIGLASSQLSRIVVALMLARILGPTKFAPIAAGAVFMTYVSLSVDLGLVSAIIQRPSLTSRHLSTAALMSWACGSLFAVGTVAACLAGLAGPLGSTTMLLFCMLSVAPLIRSVGLVSQSRLYREQRQHLIGMAETGVALISLVCCVVALVLGLGEFAYVVSVLAADVALTIAWIWMSGPFPWPRWDRESFRELWSFSSKSFGSDALAVSSRNLDSIIVGWMAGAAQLSVYSVGVRFLVTPVQFLGEVIVRVALPEFSERHRAGQSLGPVLLSRTKSLSIAIWPTLTMAFFVAPWLVPVVLGEQWSSAVPVTQILCVVGAAQVSVGFVRPAMWSVGAVKPYFLLTVAMFAVSLPVYLVAANWGAVGIATGYALIALALAPAMSTVGSRRLGLRPARTLAAVFSGVPVAAAVALPVLLVGFLLRDPAQRELVQAAIAVALFLLVMVVAFRRGLLHPRSAGSAPAEPADQGGGFAEPDSPVAVAVDHR
ncbi:oligosaccharide flippase family protein [Micromonospora taraxaci]|uniref:oligosaccharide flippase family protein n=1 Tax=Micromonospora taraxaci TaxID=1316803 RepID=UPI0033DBE057